MAYEDIEESRMYQRAERLADMTWDTVIEWDEFAKDTIKEEPTKYQITSDNNEQTN